MTDERNGRRPRRVATPKPDDVAVTIRRVSSDGSFLGTTAPGAVPTGTKPAATSTPKPTPKPSSKSTPTPPGEAAPAPTRRASVARPRPVAAPQPGPVAAPRPQRVAAPRPQPAATPPPRPAPDPQPQRMTADADDRAFRTIAPLDVTPSPDARPAGRDTVVVDESPFDFDDWDEPTAGDAPLGNVSGDAPLEPKTTTGTRRDPKHDVVDDARRRDRNGRLRRHPGRGLFGGALVGAGVTVMCVLYGFLPLGELTLALPVVVLAVVGALIGSFGPARGRRPAKATMHVPDDSPTLTGITPITPLTTTATADPDAHRMSGSEDLGTVFGPTGHDDDLM